jgi:hypothetical protein
MFVLSKYLVKISARLPFIVIEVLCGFPESPQANAKLAPAVGQDFFVPLSFASHSKSQQYVL